MQSRISLLWKLSLLFAVWSSLVFSQPIVLDFIFTVGTVFSVIEGIIFNFLPFQTFLFTGAPAKLFTSGMYCEIYFPVFPMGEINCFMWEAWENNMMHSLHKRSLKTFFLFAVGYSAFYLKLENFFMCILFFPLTCLVLSEETESLKLFPNMFAVNLVTVKLVVSDIRLGINLPNNKQK